MRRVHQKWNATRARHSDTVQRFCWQTHASLWAMLARACCQVPPTQSWCIDWVAHCAKKRKRFAWPWMRLLHFVFNTAMRTADVVYLEHYPCGRRKCFFSTHHHARHCTHVAWSTWCWVFSSLDTGRILLHLIPRDGMNKVDAYTTYDRVRHITITTHHNKNTPQ